MSPPALLSRELPDIEVCIFLYNFLLEILKINFVLQNLLLLNPRVQTKGSIVPSAFTKTQRKHWKRNVDKSCVVSEYKMNNVHITYIVIFILSHALRCKTTLPTLNTPLCRNGRPSRRLPDASSVPMHLARSPVRRSWT